MNIVVVLATCGMPILALGMCLKFLSVNTIIVYVGNNFCERTTCKFQYSQHVAIPE